MRESTISASAGAARPMPAAGERDDGRPSAGAQSGGARRGRGRAYAGNVLAFLAAAAVIGGLVWFFDRPAGGENSQSVTLTARPTGPGPRVGKPAPDFQVAGLDGEQLQLSGFRGRPVWINFWATWCPPCRAESHDIQAAYEQYRDAGLVVLAIDIGEDPGTVRGYLERAGLTFTVGLDETTEVAALYRIAGIPSHYFVDSDGVLRDWKIGAMGKKEMDRKLGALLSSQP